MLKSVQQFQESKKPEHQNVLHAAALALHAMTQSNTVNALLYIARSESSGTVRYYMYKYIPSKYGRTEFSEIKL